MIKFTFASIGINLIISIIVGLVIADIPQMSDKK